MMNPLTPHITQPTAKKLLGCVYYGDPFHSYAEGSTENEIGRLWTRFGRIYSIHLSVLNQVRIEENVAWEAHIQTEEYDETKEYTVFVGIEVREPPARPIALFYKTFPKTRYAIFTIKSEEFITSLEYIYNIWLPHSTYQESHSYMLWRYDEQSTDFTDPHSILQAFIPIEEKTID
jgi:AraC family transcriptional regulator